MPAQRQASAMQIIVGSDRAWGALRICVAVLAGGALLAALMSQSGLCFLAVHLLSWLLIGMLLPLLGAGRIGRRCSRIRFTSLRWGWQQWWLDERPVRPRVVIDLGSPLLPLLALRSCLARYLPLARARCAAYWPQLQATPYSACIVPSREP